MKTVLLILLISLMTACASQGKTFVDDQAPTMKAIYDSKFNTQEGLTRSDLQRDTGSILDENKNQGRRRPKQLIEDFYFLPNPVMKLYIYPHLTSAGTPVPGYSTAFRFYKSDQIALHGEVLPHDH